MSFEPMTEEKALDMCQNGCLDCSQLVFAHGAEMMGLMDAKQAYRIGACFGGGMMNGETCGCVTGALMAIGLKQGHCEYGDQAAKDAVFALKAEFEEEFKARYGSLICRELIGYDFSKPEDLEKIMTSGVLWEKCPAMITGACEILEDIL